MDINFDNLTHGEAELVKWQYRLQGDFNRALWETIARADEDNLMALSMGYPEDVKAFVSFSREEGYWKSVQKKAGLEVGL